LLIILENMFAKHGPMNVKPELSFSFLYFLFQVAEVAAKSCNVT